MVEKKTRPIKGLEAMGTQLFCGEPLYTSSNLVLTTTTDSVIISKLSGCPKSIGLNTISIVAYRH
jgi:hypothetical protein